MHRCYGASRLAKNVADMTGREPSTFFVFSWKFSAPGLILIIWMFTIMDFRTPSYNNGQYEYPAWCHALGWLLTLLSLSALPVLAIVEIFRTRPGGNLWQKFCRAWESKINHCPCCGAKLDESKRAHSDRSLDRLLGEAEEENQYFNTVSEEKPELV